MSPVWFNTEPNGNLSYILSCVKLANLFHTKNMSERDSKITPPAFPQCWLKNYLSLHSPLTQLHVGIPISTEDLCLISPQPLEIQSRILVTRCKKTWGIHYMDISVTRCFQALFFRVPKNQLWPFLHTPSPIYRPYQLQPSSVIKPYNTSSEGKE